MRYTVVTTFNQAGLEQYGQRMIDSFEQHWPQDVSLLVYAENCAPRTGPNRVQVHDILAVSNGLRDFLQRHQGNPRANGQEGPPGVYDPRKAFRWNAVRFSYKVYAISEAACNVSGGYLIWLDADTVTHTTLDPGWLAQVCPQHCLLSYLGRGERYHSECGWVGYNLDHEAGRRFITDFRGMYDRDEIFQEREWHDSYIFDVVRRRYATTYPMLNLNRSINDKGLAGHPFINSELGLYMDHAKGKRKDQGHSKGKDIMMHLDHPYWKRIRKGSA